MNSEKECVAYPMQYADDSYQTGMTLRDYFAAKAMQSMLTTGNTVLKDITQASYVIADAMLEARK